METVLKAIADWIKGILTAGIMSNLSGLFDAVNEQVGDIAQQVGTRPSAFEPRVFAMIESLSRNVVLPIAGIILTFIACYELIEMITQHNNMAQFEPALIMRWIFKTAVSVWFISNTFDIVMAVFDLTQKVVSDSSGIIAGNTRVNEIGLSMLEASLMQMDVGPLFGLFLQSFFIGITMRILSIVIFVIVYGRIIEIYNSTALDSTRKFRDFLLSGLAVQRLSDLICLEHQLSVIEIKPYRERQKRTLYPPRESNRDKLCAVIDNILLSEKPASFEGFLQKLEQRGYEIKRGKYTSVKGTRQKRFIRFRTLGAGYNEDEIKAVIAGEAEHRPHQKQPPKEQPFHLLVDIQAKLSEGKSEGYARWAKRYNLKEMSKTLIFLQENKIGSIEEMQERVDAATAHYHELGDSIKAAEKRLAEIAVLKAHIINYAKTRPVYDAYRKTGYSKHFLETHRTEITLHKAAKAAFNESNLKTLPKVKELDVEYSKLLTEKKARYPDYRKAKEEMQEFLRAKRNVELFFAEEKSSAEKMKSR